jgi:Holliday junction DNA helicase RuvA
LINLGYNQGVAQKAIKKTLKEVPEGVDLAALISGALKNV